MKLMYFLTTVLFSFILFLAPSDLAYGFCGFYVGKADANLFNNASKVILVRHENKTILSMMNDYEGPLREFALVVPVPTILKKEQVHIGDKKLFDRIDSFTSPRLVEYFDKDPCQKNVIMFKARSHQAPSLTEKSMAPLSALGVKVEESFTIGEYDIVILSAKESDGLETWLRQNQYSIPEGTSQALKPYIKQNMKFFVAKVNIKEQIKAGSNNLRPLQFAFKSEKFMLPIRLGLINANGPQELFIYMLTKNGRVETTNYPTIKIPSNVDIPAYVKGEFENFYVSLFNNQVKKEEMRTIFMEYFWDMGWCDPCATNPLTRDELQELGVFWFDNDQEKFKKRGKPMMGIPFGMSVPVKVTRLHLRYTKETFPEDLIFHETDDKKNFQGRYVIRHPWKGSPKKCEKASQYFQSLKNRRNIEAQSLARLTGWKLSEIRKKMNLKKSKNEPWWKNLWH